MNGEASIQRETLLRKAVLAGDEAAWRSLYEESYAGLERYVLWRCGRRRAWADEAIQDCWLVAVRRIRDFDPQQARFGQWLTGIAANVLRSSLRKWLKERNRRCPLLDEPSADMDGEADGERIALALANLPERQERVLRHKYLEQQSVDEIAAIWRETPKAVESLLSRARAAFREAYEGRGQNAAVR